MKSYYSQFLQEAQQDIVGHASYQQWLERRLEKAENDLQTVQKAYQEKIDNLYCSLNEQVDEKKEVHKKFLNLRSRFDRYMKGTNKVHTERNRYARALEDIKGTIDCAFQDPER